MLEYLAWGARHYGDRPILMAVRHRWEFQAVVAGACAPVIADRPRLPMRSHRLWVFSPLSLHGWTSEPGHQCEVAVAQYSEAPAELQQWMGDDGCVEIDPGPQRLQRFASIVRSLEGDYRRFDAVSHLRTERALLEIVLLAIESMPQRLSTHGDTRAQRTAALAVTWFEENMALGPSVADVAKAVHVSPAHLRRLFIEAGRGSPLTVLRDVQLARARELLARTDMPVKQIALTCGFSAPSVFTRVFHALTKVSPTQWRIRRRRGLPPL